ncbi:MAG TPA: GNAT family N-acetyltransferase, partial [Anaerolineaceae bacterium]|nr:GNAT family N-acetyltransferase [Anaerolineaceae bacterium]
MTTQPKTEILPTFPPLETERLHLRLISLDDTDFIHRHFSDPRVTQYLMDAPPVVDVAEARDIIRFFLEPEGKTRCRWVLARKADQRVIGTCGFHRWEKDYHRAEIGYDLSPEFWGQGYMREALRAVIPH